ncbi:hypothetical protein, partial [Exiguobacterium sp.]|uniref:hypothetical protein n=1 Tax=Exiguobacterium sp. TaxID=44751 RepID=UPI00391AC5D4
WRDRIHTIFSILCRAERLKLIEPKKRRTNSRKANWFVNSLKTSPASLFYFLGNLNKNVKRSSAFIVFRAALSGTPLSWGAGSEPHRDDVAAGSRLAR